MRRGQTFDLEIMGENQERVDTCIPGEGLQCRIVEKERDSESQGHRSAG